MATNQLVTADPLSFLVTIVAGAQLMLAAGPKPRSLGFGCRVRVWTGELGTCLGRTRDGWVVVALDGERTLDGRPRADDWQRWQVEAIADEVVS